MEDHDATLRYAIPNFEATHEYTPRAKCKTNSLSRGWNKVVSIAEVAKRVLALAFAGRIVGAFVGGVIIGVAQGFSNPVLGLYLADVWPLEPFGATCSDGRIMCRAQVCREVSASVHYFGRTFLAPFFSHAHTSHPPTPNPPRSTELAVSGSWSEGVAVALRGCFVLRSRHGRRRG